ncbi:MAG TPA: 3-hydroxyacyl-CoA dehydrogenase NAD-binding domain-containing protein [Phycisphaerae bacterium]|nr:3-hydroxyacyl-CoA dehydrogenase NAD-binding domain-containing protein [Phycisphaerae bacterium]
MSIETALVIGSGTMGRGIAQVAATAGLTTYVYDANADQVASALDGIGKSLSKLVEKGKVPADVADGAKSRLKKAASLDDVDWSKVGIVIEAIYENFDAKTTLYGELQKRMTPQTILASNTSSISITKLAAATDRPTKFIGMHFFNPVPLMSLVEVIRGIETDDATIEIVESLAKKMGKNPLRCNDMPGFVSNRVLMPLINEAAFALMENVADATTIDEIMKQGCNFPMGPLTLADFIGVDVCLNILEVLHRDLGDPKFRPCPLLRKMVDAGHNGRKSGRGFHVYSK